MVVDKNSPFTKQMKKATQEIHDLSDAMINAKLGIGTYTNINLTLYSHIQGCIQWFVFLVKHIM